MKQSLLLCFLAFGAVWAGCAIGQKASPSGNHAAAGPNVTALTKKAAEVRSRQVTHVSYSLWFRVDGTSEDFQGRSIIKFEIRPKGNRKGLFIDFEEGTLHSLKVNGVTIPDAEKDSDRYDGHRIQLKSGELVNGSNRVEVAFAHKYSRDGNGLYRFKDPVDGNPYLYTNLEPFQANRVFPCFDQPDLKASYELTVEAPEAWEVISNTAERDTTMVDGRKSWAFPPSPVFSTYVFALHAGPYASWKSEANGIPLRLFARKSLAQYVDSSEWFDITRQGLDYYTVEFGYPYPYPKYDQIIVPDMRGAMENVAAVTFGEDFVYRTRVTTDRRRDRADVILHEMAHMWFGDLVTMRWWNGLWLNESFASFMSAMALDHIGKYPAIWHDFFADNKIWAYHGDQLVTTHPIEVHVPDTDQAEANFDAITYGKGASVLKQLYYFLGEDQFREGVQRYFQRFALRNTTIGDFMKMLSEASDKDLSRWQKVWLQTPGVNTVRAEWACGPDPDDGKPVITKMRLIQGNAEQSTELRPHETEVALFYFKPDRVPRGASLKPKETYSVTYTKAETTVDDAIGDPCPTMVFPNHDDQDYVKIELDPISFEAAVTNIGKFEEPLLRHMLWNSLFERVIDGKMKAQDYVDLALAELKHEKNTDIIQSLVSTLIQPRISRLTALKILPPNLRDDYHEKLERLVRRQLQGSHGGTDAQLVWFHAFLDVASEDESVAYLQKLLAGKVHLFGMPMDQQLRWEVLKVLARNQADQIEELIAKELAKDPSALGAKEAIRAEVAIPSLENKKKWFTILAHPKENADKYSQAKLMIGLGSFLQSFTENLPRTFLNDYFAALPALAAQMSAEDEYYFTEFTRALFPTLCEKEPVDRAQALLATKPNFPATAIKSLRSVIQEEERCVRARAVASPASEEKPGSGPSPSPSPGATPTSAAPEKPH